MMACKVGVEGLVEEIQHGGEYFGAAITKNLKEILPELEDILRTHVDKICAYPNQLDFHVNLEEVDGASLSIEFDRDDGSVVNITLEHNRHPNSTIYFDSISEYISHIDTLKDTLDKLKRVATCFFKFKK